MKHHRSFLSLVLVLALFLSMAVPGLAAQVTSIETWAWTQNSGLRNGVLYLAPSHYYESEILLRLPKSILVNDGQQLTVSWDCPEFPAEGVSWGTYDFDVVLPEGYAIAEECKEIFARVIIVYPEDEPLPADSAAVAAAAPVDPNAPKVETVTTQDGNKTTETTTITHPDGTTDVTVIVKVDDQVDSRSETRTFPDGYYTSGTYSYSVPETSGSTNTDCDYYVTMLLSEGYVDTRSSEEPSWSFRPITVGRIEYDADDKVLYDGRETAIYGSNDPANPKYYEQNGTGNSIMSSLYYVYDTDDNGNLTQVSVYSDANHQDLVTQTQYDDAGTRETHYPDADTTIESTYDANGVLTATQTTTVKDGTTVIGNTTYVYDSQGRQIYASTLYSNGQKDVSTRTYYDQGDYTEEVYHYADENDTDGKLTQSSNVNGLSGRAVSRTTYADDTATTVEYIMGENGSYIQTTVVNPDQSYSVTRYDSTAGADVTVNYNPDGTPVPVVPAEPPEEIIEEPIAGDE